MYQKTDNASVSRYWKYSTISLSIIVVVLGIVLLLGPNQSATTGSDTENTEAPKNPSTQEVAILGRTQPQHTQTTIGATPTPSQSYIGLLQLADGWTKTESVQAYPCADSTTVPIQTFQKDTLTIKQYELTTAVDCEPLAVGDVSLNYRYNADNSGITIDTTTIDFCTKDLNPKCPKGDGAVSVYIVHSDPQSSTSRVHPLTKKTYAFEAVDASVTNDTSAQARNLATLIQNAFRIK